MAKGSLRVNGIIVDTDGEIKASTGDSIVIREDDGSAVITVDTSGNVGINTTAPGALFDIRGPAGTGSASASVLRMSTAETSVVDADQLGRIEFIAPLEAGGTDAILVGASIHAEADATFAADNNSTELVFSTGASEAAAEKMRITSGGNVGIGTTAPDSYDTRSNNLVVGDSGDAGITIFSGASNNATIQFAPSGATGLDDGLIDYDNNDDSMAFQTAGSNRMIIKSDGKVGIGTTAPDSALHINQTGSAYALHVACPTNTTNYGNGIAITVLDENTTSYPLYINTNSADEESGNVRFVVRADGKVGIGTSAPDQLLVLAGTGNVINKIEAYTTTAAQGPALILARSNNGTLGTQTAVDSGDMLGAIYFQGSSGTAFATGPNIQSFATETFSGTATGGDLRFFTTDNTTTTSDERMRITNAGRVLIGDTVERYNVEAYQQLQLEGLGYAASSMSLFNNSADTNGAFIYIGKSRGTSLGAITRPNDGDTVGGLTFFVGDNNDRASRVAAILAVMDGANDIDDTPGELLFQTTPDGTVAPTTRMVIRSSGGVGIGTTDPDTKLEVRNSSDAYTCVIQVGANGVSGEDREFGAFHIKNNHTNAGGAKAVIEGFRDGADNNAGLKFNATESGSEVTRVTIKGSNGHVGIGTTAPDYLLNVKASVATWVTQLENSSTSGNVYVFRCKLNSNPYDVISKFIECTDTTGDRFQVFSNGTVKNSTGTYGTISDERIKTDIVDANSQWDDVKAVRVRNFKRKAEGDKAIKMIGVVAQELEKVSPGLVDETPPDEWHMEHCGFGKKVGGKWVPKQVGGKDMTVKGVSTSILYMKAFKALQEAMAKIETLETKVKTLEDAG